MSKLDITENKLIYEFERGSETKVLTLQDEAILVGSKVETPNIHTGELELKNMSVSEQVFAIIDEGFKLTNLYAEDEGTGERIYFIRKSS